MMPAQSSQVELDGAKAQNGDNPCQIEGAKSAWKLPQKRLDDCLVKAPIFRRVAVRNIIVGNMASPQSAALTLINAKNVIVHINVTENQYLQS
jgi:multidrug resistance efflux pump